MAKHVTPKHDDHEPSYPSRPQHAPPPAPKPESHPPDRVDHAPTLPKRDAAPPKRDALKTIGLETGVAGDHTYVDCPEAFEPDGAHVRKVLYLGQNYEHTSEDGDGCWIYRQM